MSLQIEYTSLKKEKDDLSKKRLEDITNKIDKLKEEERSLREAWEEEKKINNLINEKKAELEKSKFKLEQA